MRLKPTSPNFLQENQTETEATTRKTEEEIVRMVGGHRPPL